jgi:replicative DNA helicase
VSLCLRSNDALVATLPTLKPGDFTQRPLRHVYDAIQQVRGDGVSVNAITVVAQLQLRDKLDDVGGAEFVQRLATAEINGKPEEIGSYNKSLRKFTYRRRLKYLAEKLVSAADEPDEQIDLGTKVRDLMRLAEDDSTPEDVLLNPGEIVEQVGIDKLFNPMLGQKVIDTPWENVNKLIIGYFPSTLNVIGGRPGSGKSTWAAQLLYHNAKKGIPCAFFSLEMKREAILRRLLCGVTNVSLRKCYENTLTHAERGLLTQAMTDIKDIPLKISNLYGRTTVQIEQAVRQVQAEIGPLAMIAVDHIQLMRPLRKHNTRAHEVGEISGELKVMSGTFDSRIIALSQLSRAGKDRADQRPVLTDLRESGDVEQDADTVGFVHRPEMYKKDGDKGKTEFISAKQRDGELGHANLQFEGRCVKFTDDYSE